MASDSQNSTNSNQPGGQEKRRAAALKYNGNGAPRVTAKGEGDVAAQIEAIAAAHDVPILQDFQLSAVLSTLPLGEEIPENLYVAVANVLAFIYDLNDKVPEGHSEGRSEVHSERYRREKDITPAASLPAGHPTEKRSSTVIESSADSIAGDVVNDPKELPP